MGIEEGTYCVGNCVGLGVTIFRMVGHSLDDDVGLIGAGVGDSVTL